MAISDTRGRDTPSAVRAEGVSFAFEKDLLVVNNVDISIPSSGQAALLGPSGSGKSTLLHLLSGILVPTTGSIWCGPTEVSRLDADERARFRLEHFGFVFQFAELLPELTLLENVELPLLLLRKKRPRVKAAEMLAQLDLAEFGHRLPHLVSGGQRQRAAIARALVHEPLVVFADEPTGALDQATGQNAMTLMIDACRKGGAALVVVTHDEAVATRLSSRHNLVDGSLA